MKIIGFIIGVILFGMIILGSSSFLGGFAENYKVNVSGTWNETYVKLAEMENLTKDFSGELEGGDITKTNWFVSGLEMGYKALKTSLKMPQYLNAIFQNIGSELHLPSWVANNLLVIFTLIIVFILASALIRWYI